MPKSKLSAIVSLLLVFLSGVLVGGVSYRLYTVSTVSTENRAAGAPPPREDPEVVRTRIVHDMRDRLGLDEDQVKKLNKIYDDTRVHFDELHSHANSETRKLWDEQTNSIKAILRPDQLPKYEELRRQRDEERRKRRRMDQKGGFGQKGGFDKKSPPPE